MRSRNDNFGGRLCLVFAVSCPAADRSRDRRTFIATASSFRGTSSRFDRMLLFCALLKSRSPFFFLMFLCSTAEKGLIPWPFLFRLYSVMSGGRSSPRSAHVYRGGFKLPKHLKSPLHAPEGDEQSAFGIGHTSPLLHKSALMNCLGPGSSDGEKLNLTTDQRCRETALSALDRR